MMKFPRIERIEMVSKACSQCLQELPEHYEFTRTNPKQTFTIRYACHCGSLYIGVPNYDITRPQKFAWAFEKDID